MKRTPMTDVQRLQNAIRNRVYRMIRDNPTLGPVRSAVHDYCAARALCDALQAYSMANPGDHVAAERCLAASLERRHAFRLLQPYLPKPDPDWIPPEDRDVLT